MNYFNNFIYDISLLLFVFLILQSGYLFFFALVGRLTSLKNYSHATRTGRFVIYLFCDNEKEITKAVQAVCSLCYPAEKKHVIVITNRLQTATAMALQDIAAQIIELDFNRYSKIKVLQVALAQTKGMFDYALLLAAKDVCVKGFLYRMNDALQSGFDVVQGQHIIKNTSSAFALMEAISESVDTHIFCKSHQLLGLSSSITSSGLGIRFSLLQDILPAFSDTAGIEKEMELYLLRKHVHFGYAPKACLYEESKNRSNHSYQKYHRWAKDKSFSLQAYLSNGISELCKGNVDFFDKVFQSLLLPRILLLGITPLAVLLSFLNLPLLPQNYWIALWIITYTAICMSMPAKYITHRFLKAVLSLPVSFISMVKMFLKPGKKSNQTIYSSAA